MLELLNELSELVYIVDVETHELLFMNTAGREMFGLDEICGQRCHRVLYGKEQPCEFCNSAQLKTDSFLTWEHTNPLLNRHYLLKDKKIEWNGRAARIQIAFDITGMELEKAALQSMVQAERLTIDCAKLLQTAADAEVFHALIARVGQFSGADHAFAYAAMGSQTLLATAWPVLPEHFVHIPDRWKEIFKSQRCIVVENTQSLRTVAPKEYKSLQEYQIDSLIVAPLELDGQYIGYIGVGNPRTELFRVLASTLSTLAFFIAARLSLLEKDGRLEHLSYYDPLTGVQNRNAYIRDLQCYTCQPGGPVGIAYVDVNDMRGINDQHGHSFGDKVLRQTADLLRSYFSPQEIYRIGGDEFVVICKGISQEAFETFLVGLKDTFAGNSQFRVSLGHCWSKGSENIQDIIRSADEQMNADKKLFYHGTVISHRYRHRYDDVLGLTEPNALERMITDQRFLIYYQPKFSVLDRSLMGAEALIRYQTHAGIIVSPDQFIPILEQAGLISTIDFYVLDSVCAKLQVWISEKRPVVPISVNFSRHSLMDRHFIDRLNTIWSKYTLPHELVEIEVTESSDVGDNLNFLHIVDQIRADGFAISIDDFGIKYSNLSLFTSIDFDVLKIDKSLVDHIQDNCKAQAVLQSITDICRKMNICLIVEGIETEEQFEIVRQMNCDGAQGYLFSRPIPTEAFESQYLSPNRASQEAPPAIWTRPPAPLGGRP